MPARPLVFAAAAGLLTSLTLAPGSVAAVAPAVERVAVGPAAAPAQTIAGAAVGRALVRRERVSVVVALRPDALPTARRLRNRRARVGTLQRRVLRRLPRGSFRVTARWRATPGFAGTVTRAGLRRLVAAPEVLRVDLDRRVRATLAESTALIGADQVYASGVSGAGITVAVLDTGVDTDHPDLANDLVGEQCFAHLRNGAGGCANGESVQSGPGSAEDDEGHGTAVAGIITSEGIVSPRGVAPAAKIVAVKVLAADGGGTTADIVSGLDWVVNNRPDVKIVNMSIGGGELFSAGCDEASAATVMQASLLRALRSRGVTIFVASGNNASATEVSEPSCVEGVVSVGAVYDGDVGRVNFGVCADSTTAADKVMCISNGGARLDLLAPGGRTSAPERGGGTAPGYGTSNAAPHAAGVAALVLQARPSLTPEQLVATLKATGVAVVDERTGRTFPRVDAAAAVAAAPSLPAPTQPDPYLPASTATFTDPAGDAATGPDLGAVTVTSTEGGLLAFTVQTPNRAQLAAGESVWLILDLDRNAATGSRGGEYALVLLPGGQTELVRWSGAWRVVRSLAETVRSGGTVSFRISADELNARSDFSLTTVAQTAGAVADVAPDEGQWPFPALPLTVAKVGTGAGTVSRGGANGVACGTVCTALVARSATVTLTAAAASGSAFLGWEGACAGTAACTVTVREAATVVARFELLRRVAIATSGSGRGAVSSAPAGIACGATCEAVFPHGTGVTLTAEAQPGSRFDGWRGGCGGTGGCTLSVDGDASIAAVFSDVAAPVARALKSTGRRGRRTLLRYRVNDNSERVRLELTVVLGRRTVARLRRHVTANRAGTVAWRVPRRLTGRPRLCARATDAAGNTGPRTCAALAVRP